MIVITGLNQVIYWIGGSTAIRPANISVGQGTTTPEYTDTALTDEIYPTTSRNTTTRIKTSDAVTFKMQEDTTEGSTTVYSEHGLHSNSTTGIMFTKQTHPDIKKTGVVKIDDFITIDVGSYLP